MTTGLILERISRKINDYVETSLFIIGATMASVVAAQVFCRYILNHSLFWSEELARYCLVWLTFLGASTAYRRKLHPGVDFLYKNMSTAFKQYADAVVQLASSFLFIIMIIFGTQFSWFVRFQITPGLSLPKWIIFIIIPLSGSILLVHSLAFLTGSKTGTKE